MVRGGRSYSSSRGSYRGSPRGGGYGRSSRDRFLDRSFDSSYDKGSTYRSERYSRIDDYPKAYRLDNYSSRDRHSPDRKRPRTEGPSSRHDSYGSRYDPYPPERRGYSGERERHFSGSSPYSSSRREEFRRPPPPPSTRGSSRGRLSSRGSRGIRRDRGGAPRRRMMDRSYTIRRRGLIRSSEFRGRSKFARLRSTLIRRRRDTSSEPESSGDEKEKSKESKEKKEKAEKTDEEEEKEVKEGEEKEGEEKMEVDGEGGEKKEKPKEKEKKKDDEEKKKTKKKRSRPKLLCPQCNIKSTEYYEYEAHLRGRTHMIAMRKTATKQRSILAQMRQAQRNAQNELEKTGENITEHTVFCPLCKLNYKQERKVHQNSAAHKNMKKFLLPYCKVCKIAFKSPMVYENHLCSITHLTRKQNTEENASEPEEDNLDEFTTIDSVGELEENAASNEEVEKEEKKKERVSVGIEQIKKIESYYCDLCRMFLPRGTENEYPDILAGHCRKRFHMQRYIRHKENEDLKKRAEKLQRKETAEKEKKKEETKKKDDDPATDGKEEIKEEGEPKEGDTSKTADDKLWEAVDKDLGELLEETDGNKSDDDDEDSRVNGERFDRFKSAEKEKEDAKNKEASDEKEKASEEVKKEEESK